MQNGSLPIIALIVAVICGAIAGSRGKPGVPSGAIAGAVVILLGDLLQMPPSPRGSYIAAVAIASVAALVKGAIWGGIWGAAGGWVGRKISGKTVPPPAPNNTNDHAQ